MVFLQTSDFDLQIKNTLLSQIINTNTVLLDNSETIAIQTMDSYLKKRYDTTDAFVGVVSGETDTRNKQLVMYCIDIALYHLHSSVAPKDIPENRIMRYEQALNWLKSVANGALVIDLPNRLRTDGTEYRIVWGGGKRFKF